MSQIQGRADLIQYLVFKRFHGNRFKKQKKIYALFRKMGQRVINVKHRRYIVLINAREKLDWLELIIDFSISGSGSGWTRRDEKNPPDFVRCNNSFFFSYHIFTGKFITKVAKLLQIND